MGVQHCSFKTTDKTTLRGEFHTPANYSGQKLPCVILSHGFSAVKERGLIQAAQYFSANLPVTCLVYDQRGFGGSDAAEGQPRLEVDAQAQTSDLSDAITYAQTRPEVDPERIGIWGASFSGGNVMWVAAVDRRVKAVIAHAPLMDGWSAFANLLRSDEVVNWEADFQKDRIGRAAGKPPMMVPVVDPNPLNRSSMTTKDSNAAMGGADQFTPWKNEVTLKSMENLRAHPAAAWIDHISPTPLLLSVAKYDVVTPTDKTLEFYNKAHEPKELHLFNGGHYEGYATQPYFEECCRVQADFLKRKLCSPDSGLVSAKMTKL